MNSITDGKLEPSALEKSFLTSFHQKELRMVKEAINYFKNLEQI